MGGAADHGGEGEGVRVGDLVEQLEGVGECGGNRDRGGEDELPEGGRVGEESFGDHFRVDLFEGGEGPAALPDSGAVSLGAGFS